MYNFQIGNTYNFNTRAPAVLGSLFKNATILGIVDYNTASTYINIDVMQRTIYPLLPQGTPDNPKKYTYLLIQAESGQKTVLAYQWIDENTIAEVSSATIIVTLPNVNATDAERIRDSLALLGFTGFTIDVQGENPQ